MQDTKKESGQMEGEIGPKDLSMKCKLLQENVATNQIHEGNNTNLKLG